MNVLGEQAATLPEVDPQRPSVARIHNYLLGGKHNFAADRQAAAAAREAVPELPTIIRLNRQFLRDVVDLAVDEGIEQFLDLGCGIPAPGDTYDVARRLNPASRVVGVDLEPVAFVHGRRRLDGDPGADVLHADLLDADEVLASRPVRDLLDLDRPVCLLLISVAHFIADTERLGAALDVYRAAVPAGSLLALTHAGRGRPSSPDDQVRYAYTNLTAPMVARDVGATTALFGDWELRGPGVQTFEQWCSTPGRQGGNAGVGNAFLVGAAVKS